jgi:hypothetical protein
VLLLCRTADRHESIEARVFISSGIITTYTWLAAL